MALQSHDKVSLIDNPLPGASEPCSYSPLVSAVFPVFNEEPNLIPLYEQVRDAFQKADVGYEIVFVDNGSKDGSLEIIRMLRQKDARVCYVSLSRNFGHQGALLAGISHGQGNAVITMDADLQHPPPLIPEMIRLWRAGYEVVYTIKRGKPLSLWRRFQVRIPFLPKR